MFMRLASAALVALALAACGGPASQAQADPGLDAKFLEIAREYASYGIVDYKFSWVMKLCRVFEPPARISASADPETHGNKLYLLYAKDWDAYIKGIHGKQPLGQVIVKETWDSRESDTNEVDDGGRRHAAPARKGDRWHYPTKRHALFIMLKAEDGWKYGTVSGDGGRVFQSGRISSCASCHQRADPDSLFGLPGRPSDR